MAFQYLTNIPLDQAREEYRAWMAEGGFAAGAEEVPAGESWGRTTAPAAMRALSPTVNGPSTLAPVEMSTLLPMVGWRLPWSLPVPPRVTPW